jgi:protein MpaA
MSLATRQKIFIWLAVLVGLLTTPLLASAKFSGRPAREFLLWNTTDLQPAERTAQQQGSVEARKKSAIRGKAVIVGNTVQQTAITASIFGSGKKHVIVLGGIHGDEPSSAWVANEFATSLLRHRVPADITLVIISRVNADGLSVGTRSNLAGVDLNRNFPSQTWRAESRGARYFPGREAGSEPETLALVDVIKQWRPALIVSIHAPLNCINWDGPAERVARAMAQASASPLCENIGYETPGSLGSYSGKDLNIPTITLELGDPLGSVKIKRQGLLALRAALTFVSQVRRD